MLFLSRGRGYTLFLTKTEAVLALRSAARPSRAASLANEALGATTQQTQETQSTVVRMKLLGANEAPLVMGREELPGKVNYFIGNDPKQWRTNVPTYRKVEYKDVYPGVDLVYYDSQRQLEYDFVIAPYSDPSPITLAFDGAQKLRINNQGDVILEMRDAEIRFKKPFIYQEIDGIKKVVPGRYVVEGEYQVGFQVAAYDPSKTLIIDPVLNYSTYLGGTGTESGNSIVVDASGNAYVTGSTSSTDFTTTSGVVQPASGGFDDAFVTKINGDGTALTYSTFLGGSGNDVGNGLAIDTSRNAYITGSTGSPNFPTTKGALEETSGTGGDAFVTKLNSTGTARVYSTYLRGSDSGDGADVSNAIAVDSSGNAYVTGNTNSPDFPTAGSPFQPTPGELGDAFVTKINATGSALVYSTYLGGNGSDAGNAIAVDSSDNAYVTGSTSSTTNFPTCPSALDACASTGTPLQAALDGSQDAFIAKVDPPVSNGGGGSGGVTGGGGGCFIATAAYGSALAADVLVLRGLRDRYLVTNAPGQFMVAAYYRLSPPLARLIAEDETLRATTRGALRPVVWWANLAFTSPTLALLLLGGAVLSGLLVPIIVLRAQRPCRRGFQREG
ncbi:SBBP repeat-containing protein [Nitrospiraceae bacterium AH_259_D15_M11_P09]|nr:SBBP repeat-containing protein [Nitrospiraceae bacterium AH_259_D15_M11_P09]